MIDECISSREVLEALNDYNRPLPRIAYASMVSCVVWDTDGEHTLRSPTKAEIKACRPNFLNSVRLAQPNKILRVGKVSASNLPLKELQSLVHAECLIHPTAILIQTNTDTARLMYNRAIHLLTTVIISSISSVR